VVVLWPLRERGEPVECWGTSWGPEILLCMFHVTEPVLAVAEYQSRLLAHLRQGALGSDPELLAGEQRWSFGQVCRAALLAAIAFWQMP